MHATAGSPHASLPDSDVALLANILVLATRNMNNMTTMLAHLSVELSQSEEPRLQRVGHRVLNELSELGAALETQWDLIGAVVEDFLDHVGDHRGKQAFLAAEGAVQGSP